MKTETVLNSESIEMLSRARAATGDSNAELINHALLVALAPRHSGVSVENKSINWWRCAWHPQHFPDAPLAYFSDDHKPHADLPAEIGGVKSDGCCIECAKLLGMNCDGWLE